MVREQILSTAFDLFSQYGIKKVSMNDIARTANISKRTLYQQFEDKETLLVDGLDHRNNQYISLWKELEKGPYTVLETILLFYREVMNRPKWFTQKFYEELKLYPKAVERKNMQNRLFEQQCMEIIRRGVKEGVFEEDLNFGIVVKLAHQHLKMSNPSRSFSGYSNTEVYNTILFAFLRGICTEKGRLILDRWFVSKKYHSIH